MVENWVWVGWPAQFLDTSVAPTDMAHLATGQISLDVQQDALLPRARHLPQRPLPHGRHLLLASESMTRKVPSHADHAEL